MRKKFFKILLIVVLLFVSGAQAIFVLPSKNLTLRLPRYSRVLTHKEELKLSEIIFSALNIRASVELDGQRLNNQMGLMGLEQHLLRFPGDTLSNHNFPQAGMAPSTGAWGYIGDLEKEKYYVAIQTLYLPGWNQQFKSLKDWYKYRKVLVVNPENGRAVVAVAADAGPAKWTGKQFGGSPEVMADLGFYPKKTKGRVLVLFVDDPSNIIPLGPVNQNVNFN